MKKLVQKNELAYESMSEEAILEKLRELKSFGAENIKLVFEQIWDDADLRWHYEVEETDKEYSCRLAYEDSVSKKKQKAILAKKDKERKIYEKLKKEFES